MILVVCKCEKTATAIVAISQLATDTTAAETTTGTSPKLEVVFVFWESTETGMVIDNSYDREDKQQELLLPSLSLSLHLCWPPPLKDCERMMHLKLKRMFFTWHHCQFSFVICLRFFFFQCGLCNWCGSWQKVTKCGVVSCEARLLLFDVIHLTFEIPENFTYQAFRRGSATIQSCF